MLDIYNIRLFKFYCATNQTQNNPEKPNISNEYCASNGDAKLLRLGERAFFRERG
jgi:hypothetical protein